MNEIRTIDGGRNCLNCRKYSVCVGVVYMKKILAEIPTNGLVMNPKSDAPGIRDNLWVSLANCCHEYVKVKPIKMINKDEIKD